jgi:hypothetical protein
VWLETNLLIAMQKVGGPPIEVSRMGPRIIYPQPRITLVMDFQADDTRSESVLRLYSRHVCRIVIYGDTMNYFSKIRLTKLPCV